MRSRAHAVAGVLLAVLPAAAFGEGPVIHRGDAKAYRIATTDWGAKTSARYFGEPAIEWREQSGPTLKAIVLPTLGRQI